MKPKIIYTLTDEAPALATSSLLPLIQTFTKTAGVLVETRDISLAARVLASFPEYLSPEQKIPDTLGELGELVKKKEANIIKLPNISASIPQLQTAVKELQSQGFPLPDYPQEPQTPQEEEIKNRYDKVKGSAVNPVLREGNSDRRSPGAVKAYAQKHPHSMGAWSPDSRSHVASMSAGDFYGSEKSTVVSQETQARIELVSPEGTQTTLKEKLPLIPGEIIDAAVMNRQALRRFIKEQIQTAKDQDILFSVHLKATMMKVSDPLIFGHVVSVFFQPVFEKHAALLEKLKIKASNGLGDLLSKIQSLPEDQRKEIEKDLEDCYAQGPALAMVNSDKGITNLHVPSDVIIDASMPAAIRSSGQMWGPDGALQDTLSLIPDRSYAGVYQTTIDYCKKHGAFAPQTMGSVSNVGLMAQKAEEYGSHDKTFEIPRGGKVQVKDAGGNILLEQEVQEGDIFRMCQVKDAPIQDWVKLAVTRARTTGTPAVFWLDENRAHDARLIQKVKLYLKDLDTQGLDITILPPREATLYTLERLSQGRDTISVSGNVLRDYLTDLFPILELGTSAKMLSIVPLMQGGGLFETGAGGSAPKHVQQFVEEGHLRWDSLGEFLALAVSLEHLAENFQNPRARILAETLDKATGQLLENQKSPSRKTGEPDNRNSHFYLSLYWAQFLAAQTGDQELQQRFAPLAASLKEKEEQIQQELLAPQGRPVDLGGYYRPEKTRCEAAMRPSPTLNRVLAEF